VSGFNNFSGFTGEIRMYAGNEGPAAPPTGWLYCNGDTISQLTGHGGTHYNADTKGNDYQPLFNLLKTNSNWGNSGSPSWGADTVKLPDFRSRAPVGVHTGAATSITAGLTTRAISVTAGAETHSLTIAELAVHTHTTTATGASVSGQTVSATQPTHQHTIPDLNHTHGHSLTVDPAEHYHGIYFASNYGSAAQVGPGSVVENYYQVNTRSTALAIAGSVSTSTTLGSLSVALGGNSTITASLGSETHVHSFAQVNAENSGVSAAGTAHTILSPIIAVNYIIKV